MEKTISPWQIIEKLRIKKGTSKKIIAERLQINYNYLVDLLNGRYQSKIDDDKLRTISEVLDIPVHNLLDELHGIITDNSVTVAEPVKEKTSGSSFKTIRFPIQSESIKLLDKKPGIPKTPESKTETTEISPIGKTPLFRIVSGSKIDDCFNQPELWQQKNLEFVYVPSLKDTPDKSVGHQPLGSQGILPATVAIKLEDNSLFPPCLAGSIFIIDASKKPR
ncbi:MAG: helix-turn-helix transcriptional regulator, partial [Planctomycetota bacterium]